MEPDHRRIHLPLEKLDKCSVCSGVSTLRLCSGCGERIYCSKECQTKDWKNHKPTCKTDRVDLAVFYPFLAGLADFGHWLWKPRHVALQSKIINSPNPDDDSAIDPLWMAKVVMLGDEMDEDLPDLAEWWPAGRSDNIRRMLFQRIMREGYLLPTLTAMAIAMLARMYTTKEVDPASGLTDGAPEPRVKLKYRTSIISDFGIAKGSARVIPEDKLAYQSLSAFSHMFIAGQNPDDHYWLYFQTIKGEDLIVDVGFYTFNLLLSVDADGYLPRVWPPGWASPVLFRDRGIARNTPELHMERGRFSVLKNKSLHKIASFITPDCLEEAEPTILQFMDQVAGFRLPEPEQEYALNLLRMSLLFFEDMIEERAWKRWPASPRIQMEFNDSNALKNFNEDEDPWWNELKKWKKTHKGFTSDQLRDACFGFRAKLDARRDGRA